MALVTEAAAKAAAHRVPGRSLRNSDAILREFTSNPGRSLFDIFLSHSYMDREIVLGAKQLLEEQGLTVYVDWIDDQPAARDQVNPETAARLKLRMGQSSSLFYLHTSNAQSSKWMPWELGYFDALKGRVAILPLVTSDGAEFRGQEYLGLYPYVDMGGSLIWINKGGGVYTTFPEWPSKW